MNTIVVYNSIIPKLIGVDAITLYPFIFFKDKEPATKLVMHEFRHIIQIQRDGVFKFYTKYLYEYYRNRLNGMNSFDAYQNISYEIEARQDEISM